MAHNNYETYAPTEQEKKPRHFNKLLLILLVLMVPAFAFLYLATNRFHIRILYQVAVWTNLALLGAAGVVVVISGIMGFFEQRHYDHMVRPNRHPRPGR